MTIAPEPPPTVTYQNSADLAEQIATIFYPVEETPLWLSRKRRAHLTALLTAFAQEIRRSAIEP